jgi:putative tricarboxylic transport membrane protein
VELVLVLIPVSALYAFVALKLGTGSIAAPGPGLYPLLLAIGIFVLSVALVGQGWRRKGGFALAAVRAERRIWLTVGAYAAGILVYPVGLKSLGYIPSTIALLSYLLFLAGMRRVIFGLILASVFTVATYGLFATFLGVPLP